MSPFKGKPGYGSMEQLDDVTVRRSFKNPKTNWATASGIDKTTWETVAVCDPFAWSEEVAEWDYAHMLEAQAEFVNNPNEQARNNIASILKSLITQTDSRGRTDPYKIRNDVDEGFPMPMTGKVRDKYPDRVILVTSREDRANANNKAKEWIHQYLECDSFLAKQLADACSRLIEWLDSDAHRIVEIACQADKHDMDDLAGGIRHYSAVLRNMQGCRRGQAFLARLHKPTGGKAKADTYKQRIPYKNVLKPDPKAEAMLKRLNPGILGDIPAQLLFIFSANIHRSARHGSEALTMKKHLTAIGVSSKLYKPKNLWGVATIQAKARLLIDINAKRVEDGGKSFMPISWRGGKIDKALHVVDTFHLFFFSTYNLMTGYKIYWDSPKPGQHGAVRVGKMGLWPVEAYAFAISMHKLMTLVEAKAHYDINLAKWIAGGPLKRFRIIPGLKLNELQKLLAEQKHLKRMASRYTRFDLLAKKSAIPIQLILGTIDFFGQKDKMIKRWQDGDAAGAVSGAIGMGMGGIGGASGVVGGCALLKWGWAVRIVGGTGAAGLAVALVAMGVMEILATFEATELENFAKHCFLGDEYKEGSGKRPWAEKEKYSEWKDGTDCYIRQWRYLLNLIGAFSVKCIDTKKHRSSCKITPGFLPPGAVCEVIINTRFWEGRPGIKYRSRPVRIVIALDSGIFNSVESRFPGPEGWGGENGEDVPMERMRADSLEYIDVRSDPPNSWGTPKFKSFTVTALEKLPKNAHATLTMKFAHSTLDRDWEVQVRIDITGNKQFLPVDLKGKGKYVTIKVNGGEEDLVKSSM